MSIIISLAFYFKQILSANLDLFYFIAGYLIVKDIIKNRSRFLIKSFLIILPIMIYSCFQIIFIKNINLLKLDVNIMKVWICIFLFVAVEKNLYKLNLKKIVDYIMYIYIISIPICIIFKSSELMGHALWRLNDGGNIYSKVRLQLFYYEPSVLGFQLTILLIFVLYYLFNTIKSKEKIKYFLFLISILILTYFSKSLSGILGMFAATFAMYISYLKSHKTHRNLMINIIVTAISLISIIVFLNSSNQISLRIQDVINGNDGSFYYRLFNGYNVMINSLKNTNLLGIGFGNLNTESIAYQYAEYGLIGVIANSFMYFITEGGICSIIFLLLLIKYLTKRVHNQKSIIKLGLYVFILLSQIPGGYFTDPMNWIVYGIICSKYKI